MGICLPLGLESLCRKTRPSLSRQAIEFKLMQPDEDCVPETRLFGPVMWVPYSGKFTRRRRSWKRGRSGGARYGASDSRA